MTISRASFLKLFSGALAAASIPFVEAELPAAPAPLEPVAGPNVRVLFGSFEVEKLTAVDLVNEAGEIDVTDEDDVAAGFRRFDYGLRSTSLKITALGVPPFFVEVGRAENVTVIAGDRAIVADGIATFDLVQYSTPHPSVGPPYWSAELRIVPAKPQGGRFRAKNVRATVDGREVRIR